MIQRQCGATILWLAVRLSLPKEFISALLAIGAGVHMDTEARDGTTIRQVYQFTISHIPI